MAYIEPELLKETKEKTPGHSLKSKLIDALSQAVYAAVDPLMISRSEVLGSLKRMFPEMLNAPSRRAIADTIIDVGRGPEVYEPIKKIESKILDTGPGGKRALARWKPNDKIIQLDKEGVTPTSFAHETGHANIDRLPERANYGRDMLKGRVLSKIMSEHPDMYEDMLSVPGSEERPQWGPTHPYHYIGEELAAEEMAQRGFGGFQTEGQYNNALKDALRRNIALSRVRQSSAERMAHSGKINVMDMLKSLFTEEK